MKITKLLVADKWQFKYQLPLDKFTLVSDITGKSAVLRVVAKKDDHALLEWLGGDMSPDETLACMYSKTPKVGTNPKCCGKESRLVVQSTNLQYLFCDVCKEEVKPFEFTVPDNYDELLKAFEAMLTPTNVAPPKIPGTAACPPVLCNCGDTPSHMQCPKHKVAPPPGAPCDCGSPLYHTPRCASLWTPGKKILAGTPHALEEEEADYNQLELFDDNFGADFKLMQDTVNHLCGDILAKRIAAYPWHYSWHENYPTANSVFVEFAKKHNLTNRGALQFLKLYKDLKY